MDDLHPGDHLCSIYETEEEHRAFFTPFLRQGLEKGEKVIYVADTHEAEEIIQYLQDDGVDTGPFLATGQLVILSAYEAYIQEGSFDPDKIIAGMRDEIERSLNQGYPAIRATGETTWALRGFQGSDRLIEYESKLNNFYHMSKCLGVCQYPRQRFKPSLLLDVLATHPVAAIGTEIFDNFYYMPPSDFSSPDTETMKFCSWVNSLFYRRQAEEDLRKSRDELELRVRERTAELHLRVEQLSRLSSQLTLTEQRERRRLAGILHDHLQQLMVGAKMTQETLTRNIHTTLKPMADHVLKLINELIRTSRSLTAELSPPVLWSDDLSAILGWLARWMYENHGFKVHLEIREQVIIDRKEVIILLFQSIRELLLNVRTHAGVKSAGLRMERKREGLIIIVRDEGIGFDPEKVCRNEDIDKFGLFTIRERLMHIGGHWEVESAPNEGSTITLTVPLGERRPFEERAHKSYKLPLEKPVSMLSDKDRIRVLIVDDHPVMREGLSRMLYSQPDMEVVGEASDGEEAVQMARELVPDVILMDISMPNMDGLEATRIIHPEFPHIRIIGLSMYNGDDMAEAMIRAGASSYRAKSGNTDSLLAAIRGEFD